MPFKLNQDRRHYVPRQKHRVTNLEAYDTTLRQRGSLTIWFTDEAVEGWRSAPRTSPSQDINVTQILRALAATRTR